MIEGVLVADDDPFLRRLVATTLADPARFRLHEAADGLEALRIARREAPALILLDVDMPRADGIEVCRRLRRDPTTRSATIVMLTGSGGGPAALRARRAGADMYLTKPFSPLELLRLLDSLDQAA